MCAFLSLSCIILPISIKNICDQTRIRMYTPYIAIELSYALFWGDNKVYERNWTAFLENLALTFTVRPWLSHLINQNFSSLTCELEINKVSSEASRAVVIE